MKKLLIVGADSDIGGAVFSQVDESQYELFGTTRKAKHVTKNIFYLDLHNVDSFHLDIQFDIVILCAGLTKISECEKDPLLSKKINYDAQIKLIQLFIKINPSVHIVFLSTSAVFSGIKVNYTIEDLPDPLTVYGKDKYAVEERLKKIHLNFTILRLTKVLTPNNKLIQNWLSALNNQECLYPFDDLYLCPVAITDVVDFIFRIIKVKRFGIVHLSGLKDLTYYDLALAICSLKDLNPALIKKSQSEMQDLSQKYASLSMKGSEDLIQIENYSLLQVLKNIKILSV